MLVLEFSEGYRISTTKLHFHHAKGSNSVIKSKLQPCFPFYKMNYKITLVHCPGAALYSLRYVNITLSMMYKNLLSAFVNQFRIIGGKKFDSTSNILLSKEFI